MIFNARAELLFSTFNLLPDDVYCEERNVAALKKNQSEWTEAIYLRFNSVNFIIWSFASVHPNWQAGTCS